MKYLPYGAAFAICAVVVTAYFAFPRQVEIEKRVEVDPFASMIFVSSNSIGINDKWYQHCELWESHRGVSEGNVDLAEGQYVIQKCEARKTGLSG